MALFRKNDKKKPPDYSLPRGLIICLVKFLNLYKDLY